MTEQPTNPHDTLVKKLLESPERAAVVLRENLPATVRDRLSDDLPEPLPGSYIDPHLQETHSDRLFQAHLHDGRPVFIYVLVVKQRDTHFVARILKSELGMDHACRSDCGGLYWKPRHE